MALKNSLSWGRIARVIRPFFTCFMPILTKEPAQSFLQRLLDASPNGILVFETVRDSQTGTFTDLRLTAANTQATQVIDRPAELLVGQLMSHIFAKSSTPEGLARAMHVLETGNPFTYETKAVPLNGGEARWYEVAITKLDDGLMVTFTDSTARKLAEEALQAQANLLESVFHNSLMGMSVLQAIRCDAGIITDFRLLRINEKGCQYANMVAADVQGKTLRDIYPLTDSYGLFNTLVEVCQTNQTVELEQYYPDLKSWYIVTISPLNDGAVVAYQDITARKQIEQAWQRQSDTFRGVLRSTLNGLNVLEIIRDPAGQLVDLRYEYISEQVLHDTGLTREQFIGTTVLTLFPGTRQSRFWPAFEAIVATGEPQTFEEHYQFEGYDNYMMCQITPLGTDRVVSIYQNINELKRAQAEAQQQAELLGTVVNNSPTGLVVYQAVRDASGQIIDFIHTLSNPTNSKITGRSNEELIGLSLLDHYPSNQQNGHFDALVQVVETGESQRRLLDYRAHGINGWFDAQYLKQGDGVLFTYLDVSDSQQHRQQLEALNAELVRSNESLQSFAYVASHDLQEPLRKILAFGNLLEQQFSESLPIDARDYIGRMQGAAERMSLLIKDLLAYSRITTHRAPTRPIDLTKVMTGVLTDLDLAIHEAGAKVQVGVLPTLPGDGIQLQQLFQNLLSNAIKFHKSGTTPLVTIESQMAAPTDLPSGLQQTGKAYYKISVADNGIGFDEKYLDRIFQVFQRLHGKSLFAGSGVGLAITRRVAENHGGAITARSQPGQGATFIVYLPTA